MSPPSSDSSPAASAFAAAVAAHRGGDLEAAYAGYRAVVADRPDHADAWGNIGLILMRRGAWDEAEAALIRAEQLAPGKAAHPYNLGNLYWRRRRTRAAAAAYARAYAIKPDLPGLVINYANVLLAIGEFEQGWALYDERPERVNSRVRQLAIPEWRGESLAGKRLFVWGEQGLGDQILAARFLKRLEAEAVTYACAPQLMRLFEPLPTRLIARLGVVQLEAHDYWTHPLSIPRWLGAAARPEVYLTGRPAGEPGGIGLAWRGNQLPDPARSLPDELGRRLLRLPGARSLHPEDSGAADMQATADIIAGLDAVITIDTSVAHLAGAMGKPVWLMLHHQSADWRWEQPWYGGVEVFRQPRPGDWEPVVEQIEARVRERLPRAD